MKIAIVPGHTLTGKGTRAVGYIDEGKENRILTDLIVKWLKQRGASVYTDKIDNSNNYLSEQYQIANKQDVDLAVQIHFNANSITLNTMGTETLYIKQIMRKYMLKELIQSYQLYLKIEALK
ncbi:N-acetylmuramoyl-L-alanine amidase [Clostridioides sp. ES-S-0145-01]|uniref:N-acetylmuramoyl-L-alanine amidase n=1 Tax=Clostridioides sp. ES-S-0145-01 TaxID=2770784 RepID=UPI0039BD7B55